MIIVAESDSLSDESI